MYKKKKEYFMLKIYLGEMEEVSREMPCGVLENYETIKE